MRFGKLECVRERSSHNVLSPADDPRSTQKVGGTRATDMNCLVVAPTAHLTEIWTLSGRESCAPLRSMPIPIDLFPPVHFGGPQGGTVRSIEMGERFCYARLWTDVGSRVARAFSITLPR